MKSLPDLAGFIVSGKQGPLQYGELNAAKRWARAMFAQSYQKVP